VGNSAFTDVSITAAELSGLVGVIGLSTVTSAYLAATARIKEIRAWAWTPSAGTAVNINVDWNSSVAGIASPGTSISASTFSNATPAYLSTKPPRDSEAMFWHASNDATPQCLITGPASCVFDFHLQWVLNDDNSIIAGPSLTAGVIGTIYHVPPDAGLDIAPPLNHNP
jgi:hypothetical protein